VATESSDEAPEEFLKEAKGQAAAQISVVAKQNGWGALTRSWWIEIKRELKRQTEPRVFITLIVLDKVARALLAILLGLGLLDLLHSMAPIQFLQQLVNDLNLGAISRSLEMQIEKLANLPHGTLIRLAIGAYGYAALELVEGIGLLRRRRWAEYLTLVATLIPIPFIEIPELLAKFTFVRLGALVINSAIVIYLIIARKLFRMVPAESEVAVEASPRQPNKLTTM
jgi:uncharacterized membrane protein (DUF2068 family)